jgi:hypothetical protein
MIIRLILEGIKMIQFELPLKDQKQYLLSQINKLIKNAPDKEYPFFDCNDEKDYIKMHDYYDKHEKTKITIPGCAEYQILNTKQKLTEFKKKISHFSISYKIKEKTNPEIKPLNNRVMDFAGDYEMPYVPKKITRLIESAPDRKHAGIYGFGYFSNWHYLIKIDKPKTRRPLLEEYPGIKDITTISLKELYKAIIGKEIYINPSGDKGDENNYVEVLTDEMPNYKEFKSRLRFRPQYMDIIFKYYPDSIVYLNKDGLLYFLDNNDIVVGIVMLLRNN